MPNDRIVGQLTCASAAATLREEGFDGGWCSWGRAQIRTMPASPSYLRGGMPFEKTLLRQAGLPRRR